MDARPRRDHDLEHRRHPEERRGHRTGTLLSPESHALQLAPLTAKFKPWSETTYYGFGVFLINGWIVQNPSFAGYAATMAYLPSRKLAIAVSDDCRGEGVDGGQLIDRTPQGNRRISGASSAPL